MEGVKTWLSSQAADFFDIGIQELIPQYNKYLIPVVTMLRSSLSVYVFFVFNKIFLSLLVLLRAHWRLLSE
jgi:hypothetical protein